jgi:hypothetical protein
MSGRRENLYSNVENSFQVVKEFFREHNVTVFKGGRTMRNIDDLLDAAKEKSGSDNKTAAAIGVDRQQVSGWRRREYLPNDVHRAELCKLTGWSLEEVVAAVNYEKNPEYWENFLKRLGGIAAGVFVAVNLIVTPTPADAAPVLKANNATVYIMLNRVRRLKQLALGLVEQITRFRILVPQIS